jgi:uncharacterized phiE125 gp8 family phage protein
MKSSVTYEVTTLPGDEPVSLVEVKAHLRITHSDEDSLLSSLVVAARQYVESHTEKAILTQTIKAYFDDLDGVLGLPVGNAKSIESVQYLDGDGAQQTMSVSPAIYRLGKGTPSRVFLAAGETWPQTNRERQNVVVTYVAGEQSAPARIKQGMLLMIADMYENREAQIVGTIVAQNTAVERLLFPTRELGL